MNLLILLLLIYVSVMSTLYSLRGLIQTRKKRKKKANIVTPPVILNFKNDIEFLNHIIEVKIALLNKYIIKPKKFTESTIANEDDLERYKLELVYDVYKSLSPLYKNQLHYYFSEDELKTYISELIMDKLNVIILEGK